MKVAVVHDWLSVIGGAEHVLEQVLKVYPQADVFTLFCFLDQAQLDALGVRKVTPSFLNKLPRVEKYYRKLLSFFPLAVESFDLSGYDLVISSSYAAAKGVITAPNQKHVSYVHSPARYAWDLTHQYLRETGLDKGMKGLLARHLLGRFRIWDCRTANGVDHFVANSSFIRARIWKVYRRAAEVIYPPVDIAGFSFHPEKEDFYLTASRMVPYKRIALIAQAFAGMPDKKLVIIGDGPEMARVRAAAEGAPNITVLGYQPTDVLRSHMQRAKAFVFAAEEDFGIVPVEAQACGTPVIAFGAGGALETVVGYDCDPSCATGVFFDRQDVDALRDAVARFETVAGEISPENCRRQAEKFAPEVFREKLRAAVDKAVAAADGASGTGTEC